MIPSAVTFDLWNTLLVSPMGGIEVRREFWQSAVEEEALDIPVELLQSTLELLAARFEEEWLAGRQYRAAEAMEEAFVVFGDRLKPSQRPILVEAFDRASTHMDVHLVNGAVEVLNSLAARGLPLGLVSDTGLSGGRHLRLYLENLGLQTVLGSLAFSDEVGVYKPQSEIFLAALTELGVMDPIGAVHVGDLRRTDVAGARALGMTTIRFKGVVDDESEYPEADYVIEQLVEIPETLGLT